MSITKKILIIIAFITMLTGNVQAGWFSDYNTYLGNNIYNTWNCGGWDLYVPFYSWHNRLTYDDEHINTYNEEAWGGGIGRSITKGNEWHGIYFMMFKDSNSYLQTIGGYAYLYNWNLDKDGDWKIGVGYTLSLTQRHEYSYIPLPLPLPIGGISYKNLHLEAAYVPGYKKNDGNILFIWAKISL